MGLGTLSHSRAYCSAFLGCHWSLVRGSVSAGAIVHSNATPAAARHKARNLSCVASSASVGLSDSLIRSAEMDLNAARGTQR